MLRLERAAGDGDESTALDGATDGRISGCYLHGVFATREVRHGLLFGKWAAGSGAGGGGGGAAAEEGEAPPPDPLDMLADHLCGCGLNFEALAGMLAAGRGGT